MIKKRVAKLSFLATVIYAFIQYEDSKLDARVKQTLSFLDKFYSSPVSDYREDIDNFNTTNADSIEQAFKRGADAAGKELYNLLINNRKTENSLNMMLDFYDALAACVKGNVCDGMTANQLFNPRADDYYKSFLQYIQFSQNRGKRNYGSGLIYLHEYKVPDDTFEFYYRRVFRY